MIIGAEELGRKELLAVADGYRESAQSWREGVQKMGRSLTVEEQQIASSHDFR